MPCPWASTSILSRQSIQISSFPRKRASSVFELFSSWLSQVSPVGKLLFLLNSTTNAWVRDLFGAPVGPAEKRRALRGRRRALSEHPQSPDCGCELRSRLRDRASQGSRAKRDRDRRGRLLLVPFLGEARKGTRHQAKRRSSTKRQGQSQRHWIPAFAGMTVS